MAHLIDKDALVAEIRNKVDSYKGDGIISISVLKQHCEDFIYSLNTLEVKEVDFGTEVYKYIGEHFKVYDDGNQTLQNKDKNTLIGRVDAENIAKYFFELGLNAKG